MSYSETRIVIGGIAHVAIIIFITNLIKGKFGIKTQEAEDTVIEEELCKIIELKDTVIREEKT